MGMVHGIQKGTVNPDKVGGKVEKAAAEMKPKDVTDFASTKTDKLPEKVTETSNTDWNQDAHNKQLQNDAQSSEKQATQYKPELQKIANISNDKDELLINLSNFIKNKDIKDSDTIQSVIDISNTLFKSNNMKNTNLQEDNTTQSGWQGVDADLEISLMEYGFVATQNAGFSSQPLAPDEWCVVYKINDNAFGVGYIHEGDLDKLINGQEWANENDINSFLSYVGEDKEHWLQEPFINKFLDLMSYWGY
jgi:hypothetical protein